VSIHTIYFSSSTSKWMNYKVQLYHIFSFFYIQFFFLKGPKKYENSSSEPLGFCLSHCLCQPEMHQLSVRATQWVCHLHSGKTHEKISSVFGGNLSYRNVATKILLATYHVKKWNQKKKKPENISFL
jgi:hypothetical protein